jgi:hypothetical protein
LFLQAVTILEETEPDVVKGVLLWAVYGLESSKLQKNHFSKLEALREM